MVANLVKDGPAEKAGIKAGDVILSFDGKPVPEMRKLPRIVAETNIDKPVKVVLWRDGKKMTVKVDVGRLEEPVEEVASVEDGGKQTPDHADKMVSSLGITLAELTPSLRQRYKLDEESRGVVVTAVKVDSAGIGAGWGEDDRVVRPPLNNKAVKPGLAALDQAVKEAAGSEDERGQVIERVEQARKDKRKRVLMLIEGQAGLRFVALEIEEEK